MVTLSSVPALADQVRHHEWWLQALHVPTAWQSSRGGGMTVAVLDTGADPAQADLAGSVITGPDYTNSGRMPGGPFWGEHGTAVASLIAGHGHGRGNVNGIIGVAPAAKVLSVRVTLEAGDPLLRDRNIAAGLPGAIAHGIRYAVNHGANIIDLPLDPEPKPGSPGAGGSKAERSAIAYALSKKVVLVAPAGDGGASGDPVNFPAAYPGVIAVGAFDSTFTKGAFSSHQPYVTVTAAGVAMVAATTPKGYVHISSTSAASAVVAGIVALVKAQYPDLTPAQVTKVLAQSTVYRPGGGRAGGSGYGTVDAGLALLAAARAGRGAAVPSPSASAPAKASAPAVAKASHAPARSSHSSALTMAVILTAVLLAALVLLVFGFLQARRRRARAARLAPIRLAAQMQPRRPLPTASGSGEQATAATSAALAFAGPGGRAGSGSPEDRRGGGPWPPAMLPGEADVVTPGADWGGAADSLVTGTGAAAAGGGALVPANPGAGLPLPQRPAAARAPRIAGAPPWEPAPKPEGELPWTAAPPRRPAPVVSASTAVAPLPQRRAQPPAKSPWDQLAEEAWPGGPAADRPQPARGTGGSTAGSSLSGPGGGMTGGPFGGASGRGAGESASGTGGPGTTGGPSGRGAGESASRTGGPGTTGLAAGLAAGSAAWAPGAAASGATGGQGAGVGGGAGGLSAGSAGPANGTAATGQDDAPWSTPGSGLLSAGLPESAYEPAGAGRPGWGNTGDDGKPMYSWNPGDVTESFPAVSPDED